MSLVKGSDCIRIVDRPSETNKKCGYCMNISRLPPSSVHFVILNLTISKLPAKQTYVYTTVLSIAIREAVYAGKFQNKG